MKFQVRKGPRYPLTNIARIMTKSKIFPDYDTRKNAKKIIILFTAETQTTGMCPNIIIIYSNIY